jgi:hypothetical protein
MTMRKETIGKVAADEAGTAGYKYALLLVHTDFSPVWSALQRHEHITKKPELPFPSTTASRPGRLHLLVSLSI